MALTDNTRTEILSLWSKAVKSQNVAALIYKLGYYDDAANRSYYGMFQAITLLNVLHGHEQGSGHKEVLTAFNRDFVLNGDFPKTFGKMLNDLYDLRQKADYDHLLNVGQAGSLRCVSNTNAFPDDVKTHVDTIVPNVLPTRIAIITAHSEQNNARHNDQGIQ